ncbi:MAG: NAD(P)H-dependent oxidoreductase [Verrucomicrobiota bacterium]
MPKIILISSTTNHNLKLAELLAPIADQAGFESEIIVLPQLDLPLYTPEAEDNGTPSAAVELVEKLTDADALVLLAPEYNGSIPPVVTNAIAWMSRATEDWREAFNGKFAIVGTHSGGGGFKVVEAMRSQLTHLGMIVLARTFTTNFQKQQNPDSAKAIFEQLASLLK